MNQINIGNLTIDKFYLGDSSDVKIYLGDSSDVKIYLGEIKLYPKDEPQPVISCYEVISTPISQYASTTYDSVYSWSDAKWYMKNNLSQYEEYGIYDVVENISSATTYNGKLAVVGTTEYQYSGGSWVVVGTYEDASTTYEITNEEPILDNEIRLGIWNNDIFKNDFQKAVDNPNIKFMCNSVEGWSKELENNLIKIVN